MGNLGKMKLKVLVGGAPPGIDLSSHYSVNDLPASGAVASYEKGLEKRPSNIDFIQDQTTGGFIVVPMSKHKKVANYVSGVGGSTGLANPRIMWNALTQKAGTKDVSPVVGGGSFIKNMITNTTQEMLPGADKYTSAKGKYSGPTWEIPRTSGRLIVPDDTGTPGTGVNVDDSGTAVPLKADDFSTASISQETISEDIWWAIETTSLAVNNATESNKAGTPFWLYISMKQPLNRHQPTFLALRVGQVSAAKTSEQDPSQKISSGNAGTLKSGSINAFGPMKGATPLDYNPGKSGYDLIDLVFVEGKGVKLFDWGVVGTTVTTNDDGSTTSYTGPAIIDLSIANLTWDNKTNVIGFFPIAGKLCVIVNGQKYLYTRINTSKTETAPGGSKTVSVNKGVELFWPDYSTIRLIGSNSVAAINLSSMIFEEEATLQTPMPGGFNPSSNASVQELRGSPAGFSLTDIDSSSWSMLHLPGGQNGAVGVVLGGFAKTVESPGTTGTSLMPMEGNDDWALRSSRARYGNIVLSLEDNTSGGLAGSKVNKHYAIILEAEKAGFGTMDIKLSATGAVIIDYAGRDPILPPAWMRMRGMASTCRAASSSRPRHSLSPWAEVMPTMARNGERNDELNSPWGRAAS